MNIREVSSVHPICHILISTQLFSVMPNTHAHRARAPRTSRRWFRSERSAQSAGRTAPRAKDRAAREQRRDASLRPNHRRSPREVRGRSAERGNAARSICYAGPLRLPGFQAVTRTCMHCKRPGGTGARELRPYGPGGQDVCAECVLDGPPEREQEAKKHLAARLLHPGPSLLDAEEEVGPRPFAPSELGQRTGRHS